MTATKRRLISFALLLPFLLCGVAAAQNAASTGKTFVMKLATPTLNDGQHEWMRRYAAAIETKSGGRIKAELYPASQLGSIPRMIEGTQLGSIQIFLAPPEFFVGVDPRFELLDDRSRPGWAATSRRSRRSPIPSSPRPFWRSASTRG